MPDEIEYFQVTPAEIGWRERPDLGPKVWETPQGKLHKFHPDLPEALMIYGDLKPPTKKKNNGKMETGRSRAEAIAAVKKRSEALAAFAIHQPSMGLGHSAVRGSGRDDQERRALSAPDARVEESEQ